MNFNFNCQTLLDCTPDGFSIIDGSNMKFLQTGRCFRFSKDCEKVKQVVDNMGYASQKAQTLFTPVTTASKFFNEDHDHRLYISAQSTTVVGLLKIGKKKLFIRDGVGRIKEINPLCVLDFYVHESMQRSGEGKVRICLIIHRNCLSK